jgi:hypothetical protein
MTIALQIRNIEASSPERSFTLKTTHPRRQFQPAARASHAGL